MADRNIKFRIQADTKKAENDIKRLQTSLTRLGNTKIGNLATQNLTKTAQSAR